MQGDRPRQWTLNGVAAVSTNHQRERVVRASGAERGADVMCLTTMPPRARILGRLGRHQTIRLRASGRTPDETPDRDTREPITYVPAPKTHPVSVGVIWWGMGVGFGTDENLRKTRLRPPPVR